MPYFTLFRCDACGSLTALPRPDGGSLAALHDTTEYFEHPYFTGRRADLDRIRQRCLAIGGRLGSGTVASLRGRRHLDIGCDTGGLLTAATELFGTQAVGIDVAARAVALAHEAGIEAYHSDLAGAPTLRGFGLVTIVDVLEHVADPIAFMCDVESRLEPGGWCYIETPNVRSSVYQAGRLLAMLTGGRPAWLCQRLFLPEHVQYLSEKGLAHLATVAGLRVQSSGHRPLGSADINTTWPVQLVISALQQFDRMRANEILHWAVLQKPAG